MKTLIAIIVALAICAVASGAEEKSVLKNPPQKVVKQTDCQGGDCQPKTIMLYERGLFGRYYARPVRLVPVQPVLVQPVRPTVIWTPQVIWR
jgi:hypothetical protein